MGALSEVLDSLWQQRSAFLRRSPRLPSLAVYMDSDTLRECVSDPDHIRYVYAWPEGWKFVVFGMPVHEVVGCGRHVRVVEVVDG